VAIPKCPFMTSKRCGDLEATRLSLHRGLHKVPSKNVTKGGAIKVITVSCHRYMLVRHIRSLGEKRCEALFLTVSRDFGRTPAKFTKASIESELLSLLRLGLGDASCCLGSTGPTCTVGKSVELSTLAQPYKERISTQLQALDNGCKIMFITCVQRLREEIGLVSIHCGHERMAIYVVSSSSSIYMSTEAIHGYERGCNKYGK